MSEDFKYPRVGIAVWLKNNRGEVLMMKRLGNHGGGTWAPPGGKLEMGESFFECAKRETKEEANIDIDSISFVAVTNDIFNKETHYATIWFVAPTWSGEAKIMEPHKCSEMGWFNIHKLPEPRFWTVTHLLESDFLCLCRSGKKFKDCHG